VGLQQQAPNARPPASLFHLRWRRHNRLKAAGLPAARRRRTLFVSGSTGAVKAVISNTGFASSRLRLARSVF
jgi:hypothetical protein